LDGVDVDQIDALIDGGLAAADRHLADEEAGLPRRPPITDASERKSIWPFRRRPTDEQPSAPAPPAVAARPVRLAERPVERPARPPSADDLAAEVTDVDRVREVEAPAVEPAADEPAADEDAPDDEPAAELHTNGAGSDDAAYGNGDGGDAEVGDQDHVEELFARLKADRGGPPPGTAGAGDALGVGATAVAVIDEAQAARPAADAEDGEADGDSDVEPVEELDPDAAVLHERDTHLGPVEHELGRRLKRVLADEQNEVFDLLRRDQPAGLDDVVPTAGEHVRRYAAAALPDLDLAALSGAASVDRELTEPCSALASELGQSLVEPMRERIARSFDECEGDLEEVTERLRSVYREWKGQRIGDTVRHYAAAAYAWGVYEATPSDTELRWLVDRSGEACPDADDNALASGVRKGEAFPTGVLCSPAHPDCRCLVVPVGVGDRRSGADAGGGR
jgi:hypothetical protein